MNNKLKVYFVHALTSFGVLLSFFSIISILNDNKLLAFVFLLIALLIDVIDGSLARKFSAGKVVPNVDGKMLDSIVDYINFVFIPCIIIFKFDYLPLPFNIILPGVILLISIFSFSNTKLYTNDHLYIGFPSIWNIITVYLTILNSNSKTNLYILSFLIFLKIIPLKVIHPFRYKKHIKRNSVVALSLIIITFILLINSQKITFLMEYNSYFLNLWYLLNLYFIIFVIFINTKRN